jgi:4'-phosphopantetheinyl transferase
LTTIESNLPTAEVRGLSLAEIKSNFSKLESKIGAERLQRARRYKQEDDYLRVAGGDYLLISWLQQHGVSPDSIERHPLGKPFVSGMPEFNISHSGNWVVFAFGEVGRLGVDVECVRHLDINLFSRQFSQAERAVMQASPNPLYSFFQAWTKKESLMKADGRAMRIPLHSIELNGKSGFITEEPTHWHFQPFFADETHPGHVCMDCAFRLKGFQEWRIS